MATRRWYECHDDGRERGVNDEPKKNENEAMAKTTRTTDDRDGLTNTERVKPITLRNEYGAF